MKRILGIFAALIICVPAWGQGISDLPSTSIYRPAIAANGGTGNNITLNGTTSITGSASNAVTQPVNDATARIATDLFVQNSQARQRSTVYLSGITGGTMSFASVGSGAGFSFTNTGGVITAITAIVSPGSGYKTGDVLTIQTGNYDNYIMVTATSGAITGTQILNGGTGNANGTNVAAMAAIESPVIYNLSGTLTSNLTTIASNGPALGYSGIFLLYNNTTGNYTNTICLSNGSDACNGNGTVTIPQGSGNSCPTLVQTDGSTPYILTPEQCGAAQFATSNVTSAFSLNGVKTMSATAPTVSSGFGTGDAISQANGTAAFADTVGSSPGSTATFTMPAAANGWDCSAYDQTTNTISVVQSGQSSTSITLKTYLRTSGAATSPSASDIIQIGPCIGH